MADHNVNWVTCGEDGCIGVRLPTGGKCWAHATPTNLRSALKRLGEDGQLDARGVPFTQELLEQLLAAAPENDDGYALLTDARFDGMTFQGDARFDGVTFQGFTWFRGATFEDMAMFDGATFRGDVWFDQVTCRRSARFVKTTFEDMAMFDGTTFQGGVRFDQVTCQHGVWFKRATFEDFAVFNGADFQGPAGFREVIFRGDVEFIGTAVQRDATFDWATFEGDAWFLGATFRGDASFERVTFQKARQLGPMLVRKSLRLDQAIFHERVQVQVSAAAVCCRHSRFLAGVQLQVRWAQVVLDNADLAAPSILAAVPPFSNLEEGRWARALERLLPQPRVEPQWRSQPRLLSLRRADVAGLALGSVDLRACQFAAAHNLDKLRIQTVRALAHTPGGWRWTARRALAEEHNWRQQRATSRSVARHTSGILASSQPQRRHDRIWSPPVCRPPTWAAPAQPVAPAQVADLYRALRKGREDNKDEPGAADFYYGEMEMRRHAKREEAKEELKQRHYGPWAAATTEHAWVWLFWLTSGYALRAWRALVTLALVVLLASFAFALWGFEPPSEPVIRPVAVNLSGAAIYDVVSFERPAGLDEVPSAIRFSAQAATSPVRGPDRPLTPLGEWLHIALRLICPVLIGLALLSIRGRVKR